MITKLSDELVKVLEEGGNAPIKLVHPGTNKGYFLVSEEQYERLKPLFEEDPLTQNEQRFLLEQAGKRADWDDPQMDAYDQYDEYRPAT